jgi:hypothetical protein
VPRTFKYYPKGFPKRSVRPVVRFAERMSGGPPAYVRATDTSVRPPYLAYVHDLRVSFQLSFPRVQGALRLTPKGLRLSSKRLY